MEYPEEVMMKDMITAQEVAGLNPAEVTNKQGDCRNAVPFFGSSLAHYLHTSPIKE